MPEKRRQALTDLEWAEAVRRICESPEMDVLVQNLCSSHPRPRPQPGDA